MRAAVCSSYGTPDVVTVQELPAPELSAGTARVRVAARR